MKVYVILDAGKVTHLISYIEDSDCAYDCLFQGDLFQGDAAEKMREVAPYIVELDLHKNFTRYVFSASSMPSGLWGKEAGIFIRSRLDRFNLRKHFRRFTYIQVESDKTWVFFRFWEPTMIPYFLRGTDRDNLEAFFSCEYELHTIDDEGKWQKITLHNRAANIRLRVPLIKEQDFASFRRYVHMRYIHQLKNWIFQSFGNPCSIENVDGFLRSEAQFAIDTFRTGDKRIIAHYTAASWLLGERAYQSDKIDRCKVTIDSRGARTLYERAYSHRRNQEKAICLSV